MNHIKDLSWRTFTATPFHIVLIGAEKMQDNTVLQHGYPLKSSFLYTNFGLKNCVKAYVKKYKEIGCFLC